ncbi:MAG: GH25 family lysozyme [Roseburia sp.]
MKKYVKTAAFFAALFLAVIGTVAYTQAASGEWKQDDTGIWYQYSDGSYPKSTWKEIGDEWYYFNAYGYVKTGWFQVGSNWYYADSAGVMLTGALELDGESYILADSGEMLTGWQKSGEEWHYFYPTATDGHPSGAMMQENPYEEGVVKYGIDVSKWQGEIDWDQAAEFGLDFVFVRIGHADRILDPQFQANMTALNEREIPAGVYFYSTAIEPVQALADAQWIIDNMAGYTVSYPVAIDLESEVQSSRLTRTQITEIAAVYCQELRKAGYTPMIYCNEDWAKNYVDFASLGDVDAWLARYNYKYSTEYKRTIWQCSQTGRVTGIDEYIDVDLAFVDYTETVTPRTGAQEDYVKSSGVWRSDSGGIWYQYLAGGYPKDQWELIDGIWYWFDAKGYVGTVSGWYELEGQWYFYRADGTPATGWNAAGKTWYYFDEDGCMVTGWLLEDGIWYYMDPDGIMVTGWEQINQKWYYFDGSGRMVTGWQKISGKWYYMDPENGDMVTGWRLIDDNWYYFDTKGSGRMLTGWQKIGEDWYYFGTSSDGAMKTGWQKINGKWYYLGEPGDGAMKLDWQLIDGQWYYFRTTGAMAYDAWIGNYYVNNSGAWSRSR